jgi:hypothetical protein
MKTVLIAGGTGLIGSRLSEILQEKGYQVEHLSRKADPNAEFPAFAWDVEKGTIDEAAVRRADVVINLAGAGIAEGRWTTQRKKIIIESRTESARLLLKTFQKTGKNPDVYLSSAAMGYYGNRGDQLLHETDEPGTGFLAESCVEWEKAIHEVAAAGIRTVALRIGVVLSAKGGALEKMLIPLQFFVATYFGNGRQWYSWIHVDDVCRLFLYAIENEQLQGFYNTVAPNPEPNLNFTKTLANASGKPALVLPVPAFLLRLIFGEMADTILSSTRVSSEKVEEAGFAFQFPQLKEAFKEILKRVV